MKKLRIAVWHNLPSGGGKRALFYQLKGLIERGHHVESWCPPTADQTYLPLRELCNEHVVPLPEKPPWPWLRAVRGLLGYTEISRKLSAMDDHCRECASQINSGRFDVLFAGGCVFFRTTSIAKHVQVSSVVYLNEPYRWLYEALPRLPWAALPKIDDGFWSLSRWRRSLSDVIHVQGLRLQVREEIENASAFDKILVNSLYSRESVLRAYGLETTVCYLGIDLNRFKPTGEPVESFVLGLGGLSYEKGADRAIRALACVDKSVRPEFVWVCNFSYPPHQRELEELAVQCGVKFRVKVRVSDTELISLLSRASMLLYTSRLEPFGLSPLEANACGTPVVAIAEGGIRESIQHERNGLLVSGDDPKEFSRAIERIINNPAFARELGRRAIEHVRKNWRIQDAIDRLEVALMEVSDAAHSVETLTATTSGLS